VAAVLLTAVPLRARTMPREHVVAAARAGGRYVGNSPLLLALIARSIAFVFMAGSVWALLPLVARGRLGLGSGGYGLLLGCVGVGALLAATFGPTLKRRVAGRLIYAASCLVVAAAALALAVTHSVLLAIVVLIAAGAAWIMGIGLIGAAYQGQLPTWVKARGVSYYLVAFQGANGVGALCVGAIGAATTVSTAFVVIAAGLVLGAVATWWLPLPASPAEELLAEPLPLPAAPESVANGPVAVTVEYDLAPDNVEAFLAAAHELRRARRRTGATHWHLHRDLADEDVFTELFIVGSWEEHERQHERLEGADRRLLDQIDALLRPDRPRTAHHSVGVRV
jgi:MFS family permease